VIGVAAVGGPSGSQLDGGGPALSEPEHDPEKEYFRDGLTEETIAALGRAVPHESV